ncbi:DUF5959 family protein [Kitasatospora sp. NBC_01266]|uniref:DUF5959 family protein n=1 Tax=Kitasatospora sp. NBC_01266 TaxID=2903572 RepID=UPI002E37CF55|nr:DUF5959 family protein [Kitasatospora sp. NBC_01266]
MTWSGIEEDALTGQDSGVNLIHLADHDNSVVVRVLSRHAPGVLQGHDWLNAEVIVASSFANGRRAFLLFPENLASWAAALDTLAGGQDVLWLDDGHTPEFRVELNNQFACPAITVEDTPGCGVSVCVPVDVPDGWIDDLRSSLQQVLETWPSEVEKTGPGVYQWRSR